MGKNIYHVDSSATPGGFLYLTLFPLLIVRFVSNWNKCSGSFADTCIPDQCCDFGWNILQYNITTFHHRYCNLFISFGCLLLEFLCASAEMNICSNILISEFTCYQRLYYYLLGYHWQWFKFSLSILIYKKQGRVSILWIWVV